jgi:protocatechuate 3,4-dioxygenase beta subunit
MNGCLQALMIAMSMVVGAFFYGSTTSFSTPAEVQPTATPVSAAVCRATSRGGTTTSPIDEAPERASVGEGHLLTGVVRAAPDCAVIAGAKLIFWLTNPDGKYDDAHRATVYTDAEGAYSFESNFPGQYEGTRPHIHMYVEAEGYRAIETEYLPQTGQTEGVMDIVLQPAGSN